MSAFFYVQSIGMSEEVARTLVVNIFVFGEMFYLFNCRSLHRSFWRLGLFSNPWIWLGLGSMAVLQLAFTYSPLMNTLFQSAPIGLGQWLEIFLVALVCSLLVGVEKYLRHRVV